MATIIQLLALVIAVMLHEVAHGWVAEKCGDPTARMSGRITLNPLAHIDPFGSILLPAILVLTHSSFLIGWAKPVPVNFMALRNPKRDTILVSLAGVGVNFLLAIMASLILKFHIINPDSLLQLFFLSTVVINVVLGVFNLFPVPPLDGSRVIMALLPDRIAYAYSRVEPIGFFIIIFLLFTGMLSAIVNPLIRILLGFLGASL